MKNYPAEMLNYHFWASQTILGRMKELPAAVLHQEVNTSFPTIAHALNHIYAVDKTWFMVLTGADMGAALQECMPLSGRILETVDEYVSLFAELAGQYNEWLGSGPDAEQAITLNNPYAGIRETTLAEIMLHTANHGSYHRGNISTMLRQLGYASTMNDYALYWYRQPVSAAL
ncbi:DinB family protein [Paenibacillus sp. BK720]|uniref:DinB family protein n=1 Tax=Paenibacillus sp. BK720 TaxID=2587092 RepID=UPI001420173D|nr:DinB family protein [Paenibacillus sp. BK720]NIK69374.1 putative damage-inducible protein DinB [Paenibacillus sp. BK720]